MPPARTSMTPAEWGMLFALSLLWGGSFFFNGVAVKELPPLVIVFSRVALAAITLHLIMAVSGKRLHTSREAWLAFAGMGILNNVIPFSLIAWGQTQLAAGLALQALDENLDLATAGQAGPPRRLVGDTKTQRARRTGFQDVLGLGDDVALDAAA